MADAYLGEIRMFAGNFAPVGWVFCDGRLLAIAENEALFALLGTRHGGDGVRSFAVPDLRGCVPIHFGQGPGLADHAFAARLGADRVPLGVEHLPPHHHELAAAGPATTPNPQAGVPAVTADPAYGPPTGAALAPSLASTGGGEPHPNQPPTVTVQFIMAQNGLFPAQ